MNNFDKIKSSSPEEFLQFVHNIKAFSIYNYVDFRSWLTQESPDLVFVGEPAVLTLPDKGLTPCHIVDQNKDESRVTVVYKDPSGPLGASSTSPEAAFKVDIVSKDEVYTMDFIESLNRAKAVVEASVGVPTAREDEGNPQEQE